MACSNARERVSALPAMACSNARERSAASASSFFFILRASALPLASVSRAACMESSAFAWFFLTIFSNATINLNLNLSELHLAPKNFVLLLLQCCLCFFKSRLQFHLFSLKTLSDLVNFMDRSSSFSNLIHDILDLI